MLYQTYSEIDLRMLKSINEALVARKKIPDIDEKTILSTFEGHTIFSLYCQNIRVFE